MKSVIALIEMNFLVYIYSNLYNKIIYIYKWVILINICIKNFNCSKKKIYEEVLSKKILKYANT